MNGLTGGVQENRTLGLTGFGFWSSFNEPCVGCRAGMLAILYLNKLCDPRNSENRKRELEGVSKTCNKQYAGLPDIISMLGGYPERLREWFAKP